MVIKGISFVFAAFVIMIFGLAISCTSIEKVETVEKAEPKVEAAEEVAATVEKAAEATVESTEEVAAEVKATAETAAKTVEDASGQ